MRGVEQGTEHVEEKWSLPWKEEEKDNHCEYGMEGDRNRGRVQGGA